MKKILLLTLSTLLLLSLEGCYLFNSKDASPSPEKILNQNAEYAPLEGEYLRVYVFSSKDRIKENQYSYREGYFKKIETSGGDLDDFLSEEEDEQ